MTSTGNSVYLGDYRLGIGLTTKDKHVRTYVYADIGLGKSCNTSIISPVNNGLTDSATRRHLDSATLEIQDLHEYCKTGSDTLVHFLLIFS